MTGLLSDRFENLQYRGNLLPLGRDKSGELVFATPGLLVDAIKSMELPGRVLRGESVSADDVTKMAMDTMGGSGLLSRAAPAAGSGLFGINVWQGGPHKYGPEGAAKSLEHIGKGEGARAYGWGRYDAEAEQTGKIYRDNLSKANAEVYEDGKLIDNLDDRTLNDPRHVGLSLVEQKQRHRPDLSQEEIIDAAIKQGEDFVYVYSNDPRRVDERDGWQAGLDWLKANRDSITSKASGYLYKHDLPDADVARYLDWDAPLSQQPKNVKAALSKLDDGMMADMFDHYGMNYDLSDMTGKELYQAIKEAGRHDILDPLDVEYKRALSDDERASLWLAKNGIPGLKYLDGMSRSDQVQILPRRGSTDGQRVWLVDPGWKDPNKRKTFSTKAEAEAYADDLYRTRNYVTWDQDVLNRMKLLERNAESFQDRTKILGRDGKLRGLLGN